MNKSPIKFITKCLLEVRYWVLLAFLLVALATAVERVKIYIIKLLTDSAVEITNGVHSYDVLWNLVIVYALANLFSSMLWRCSGFSGMRWVTKTIAVINQRLFDYLTKHSAKYFANRFAGSLANKIGNVAGGFHSIACSILWGFFGLFMSLIADICLTLTVHYYLALALFLWMSLFVIINIRFGIYLKKHFYRNAEAESKLKGKLVDSTSNILTVQSASGRGFESKFVGRYINFARLTHLKSWYVSEWVLFANSAILSLFVLSMLGIVIYLYQNSLTTIGGIVVVVSIIVSMERNLFFLGNNITQLLQNYGQIQEGLDELFQPHEIVDQEGAKELQVSSAQISFNQISFAYEEKNVIDGLDLQVSAGEKVGVVGPSGAGKSTLVGLLLRQYEVQSGSIEIDGQNIEAVTLESLSQNIAYVPQSTELFHRSLYDNIRYGSFTASEAEVREAARLAQAAEFIEELPDKYRTYVGERGVKLSGGQRQRIAIARAILKNAPILVLDEATSALDSESEVAIQQALHALMQDKTVLAIAHRLSTLRAMDRIIVIDSGKLIESGTHDELLNQQGLYQRIWDSQASGFIRDI